MILGRIILFALIGGMAGAAHFLALAREARFLTQGGSALAISGLHLGRMVVTGLVLAAAAWQGLPTLLAATAGFMAARQVVLHRLGTVA